MDTGIYVRVSTNDQSTDSQEHELRAYCERRGWRETQIYSDQISGSKFVRPGLDALMAAVRAGKVSRVVIFKLDRLGRSLPHLALILEELQRHGVALIATSQAIDTSHSNPVGRLQLGVLAAVAEFEREIIRERVNAGLAAARARGVKLGRPCRHTGTVADVRSAKARGLGVRAIARQLKMPASTVSLMLRTKAADAQPHPQPGATEPAEPTTSQPF
jgi:DNA invertase Pin-like site-specific DNA recombinase